MIGRFPWDPFPPGEPEPKGPDPVHAALYRAAVAGADAYRAVRAAVRRERGVLRVGNRFVPDGRYRQVGFVALGHAAASMALAALDALGDRLTQGFVAGPEAPPAYLPFRSVVVPDGWGGSTSATTTLEATREIALDLEETDLLLVLLSPGALRSTLVAPATMTPEEFARSLRGAHEHGATGPEVLSLARVAGGGGVGGRLLPPTTRCDVQTLLVDRGEGPRLLGGGPTVPLEPGEPRAAGELLARLGLERSLDLTAVGGTEAPLASLPATGSAGRPVLVAGPSDALRGVTDLAFDKGWTTRVGFLLLKDRPEEAADRLLGKFDELLGDTRADPPARSKGLVVAAMATLDAPEAVGEEAACRRFLEQARNRLRRREQSVGIYRTVGPIGSKEGNETLGGAVVGASTDPEARGSSGDARGLRMRPGITDVGLVLVAVAPSGAASTGASRRASD